MFKRKTLKNKPQIYSAETEHTTIQNSNQNNKSPNINNSKQLSSNNINLNPKNRIFNIIHKIEIIPASKTSQLIKCIYCGSTFYNIHRFEAHIRIHVSFFIFYFLFFKF